MKLLNELISFPFVLFVGVSSALIIAYLFRRRRIRLSIDFIRRYILEEYEWIKSDARRVSYQSALEDIRHGSPYGEPAKDFTPIAVASPSRNDTLSFELLSEISHHLGSHGRESLMTYFSTHTQMHTIANLINTNYVQSLTQARKEHIMLLFIKAIDQLEIAAANLLAVLEKQSRWQRLKAKPRQRRGHAAIAEDQ